MMTPTNHDERHDRLTQRLQDLAQEVAGLRGRHEALLDTVDDAITALRATLDTLACDLKDLRDGRSRHDEQIRTLFRIVDQLETIVRGDGSHPGLSGEMARVRDKCEKCEKGGLGGLLQALLGWLGLK